MGLKSSARPHWSITLFWSSAFIFSSCAHTSPAYKPGTSNISSPMVGEPDQTQSQIAKLQEKIQDLEVRLSALNDKINLENGFSSSTPLPSASITTTVVEAPAAHGKVIPKIVTLKKSKTASPVAESFSGNETIDRFREAKILFDSKRYSDAVLEFSEFVKNEPEHALAPAAQYFVGMSYVHQKEYKLGEEELSRGLLAYAHSSYIPDTLVALMDVSERLNKPTKVTYYREKLQSHFPNSPQAKRFSSKRADIGHAPVQTAPLQMEGEPSVVESNSIERPEVPKISVPVLEGDYE